MSTDQPQAEPQSQTITMPLFPMPEMERANAQLKELAQIAQQRLAIRVQIEEHQRTDAVLAARELALFHQIDGIEQGRRFEREQIGKAAFDQEQKAKQADPGKKDPPPVGTNTRQDLVIREPSPPSPPPASDLEDKKG